MMQPANTSSRFNRRAVVYDDVPAPMAVSEEALALCRAHVEPEWKRRVRALLLPLVRWHSRAWEIGEGFQWGNGMDISGVRIGRYVYVGPGTVIGGPVSIGDLCMLSSNITLVSGDGHGHKQADVPMRIGFATSPRPVTVIEADCWIGYGAIIREGVTIRRGTVVAAGAVVIRDTEPYWIVGGSPARYKRQRFNLSQIKHYETILYGGVQ